MTVGGEFPRAQSGQLFPLPNGVVYFQRVTQFFAEGVRKLFAGSALTFDLVGWFGSLA